MGFCFRIGPYSFKSFICSVHVLLLSSPAFCHSFLDFSLVWGEQQPKEALYCLELLIKLLRDEGSTRTV